MKILCAYNANIDALYSITGPEVSAMLTSKDAAEVLAKVTNPPGVINSMPDFLAGLLLCMKEGTGAEWLIHEPEIFKHLKDRFLLSSKLRMGGNMGIMANVLSEMGAELVIPNVVKPTARQLSFFSKKAIHIPGFDSCSKETSCESDEPIHFVFDFKKGEYVEFEDISFTVPRENRFIATYDIMNISLFVNPFFEEYAIRHAAEMDGLLISGFHMMLENYSDGSTYMDKLDKVLGQLETWWSINNDLSIHVEFGHFTNKNMALHVFSRLSSIVGSIGMNEDELAMLTSMHEVNAAKILQMDVFSIIEAAKRSLLVSDLRKMIVHTREYVLSISRQTDLAGESQIEAMSFGVACAGIFASTGQLHDRNTLYSMSSTLKESDFGRAQTEKFINAISAVRFGRGAAGIYDGYQVCIIPTLLSDNPISTVGLGDTVTASMFLRELELRQK
ncbi:ADP-dependent glucokinase/phosphofructokinase [uncultured Methanomethylovorans sp.]|uniref:ADP-dependent glucokinase/phosphofructokinase n=1 Tax=uncultured Methanomethylovorans sp. TaxID=183759 RepID=UPI002AA7DD1F|nr:ADP-dependent glucokinase/phosphofructokinase [uncultured Methanomethylovorans sp.]